MALAAGFGLDFERCSPEVFAAVEDRLIERAHQVKRERLAAEARRRFG